MDIITKQHIRFILYNQINEGREKIDELYCDHDEPIIIYEFGELQITFKGEGEISYINHNSENEFQIDDRVCLEVKISFSLGKMNIDILDKLEPPNVVKKTYGWEIYIPEEGSWDIEGEWATYEEARSQYLSWANRKRLPAGSRIYSPDLEEEIRIINRSKR